MQKPIRVLVVDDSVFMRSMLKDALSRAENVEVVGTAQNGKEGIDKILRQKPDVVTLDIEMPGLSGLEVVETVMKTCPTAIVIVSTKTQAGAQTTLDALERGALECVAKPLGEKGASIETFRDEVVRAVLWAAQSNRCSLVRRTRSKPPRIAPGEAWLDAVIAIGISAGGPQTLHQIMPAFPAVTPPIVITQHMPPQFTRAFAERLNTQCPLTVAEATPGAELRPGLALIAPGDRHLCVVRRGQGLVVQLSSGPKVNGFRPSVDVMFHSLAGACGPRTVAIVMTGMGVDGAEGLRALKDSGAYTLAQDAVTSVVYGMPKAAVETGCVDQVVALPDIPQALSDAAGMVGGVRAATAGEAGAR